MPLHQLPEELLLQIALHLSAHVAPKHLKSLCLVSRKLRPTAQEALITTAKLAICCGCHAKVNPLIKLLRTILERPDLATKVKSLRFRAARKRIDKSYAEQGFDLVVLRDRCISKLEELGFFPSHPWWRSINNSIESAFGGLLLALLPNLIELDCWIKDHQHGPPSSECISGLWGGTSPPGAILHGWKNIQHFVTGDTSMLKCGIQLESLTKLDLRTISIGTVLRLNGPSSLQGAENIKELALTVSIQFADQPLVEKADIKFGDLLEALACRRLQMLKIAFINDGYHIGDDLTTELNSGYFISQLCSVQETLETLSVTVETTEDDGELDWLVDMFQRPITSMRDFQALKSLVIPTVFFFTLMSSLGTPECCNSWDLPPTLEHLELLWPHESMLDWAEGLLETFDTSIASVECPSKQSSMLPPHFRKLILTCREDVGVGASYFTDSVHAVWWDLSTKHGLEVETYDELHNTRDKLATKYEQELMQDKDNYSSDGDDEEDDDDDDTDDDVSQDGGTERAILACLRRSRNSHPDGLTVDELAAEVDSDYQQAIDAVTTLLEDGYVTAPSSIGEGSRLQLSRDRFDSQGLDTNGGLMGRQSDGMTADSNGREPGSRPEGTVLSVGGDDSDTDDDMPELEPIDSL